MFYLYVKTHLKTGLKYLGKTEQNPYTYRGSGNRWINHITKHGYDVWTNIVFQTEIKEELKQMGIYYSTLWNIVDSKEWANLRIEEGDGGFTHINDGSPLHIERCRKGGKASMIKLREKILKGEITTAGKFDTPKSIEANKRKRLDMQENPAKYSKIYAKVSEFQKQNNSMKTRCWCVPLNCKTPNKEKKVFLKDVVPEGWIPIHLWRESNKDKKNASYGKHWYNDGSKNYYCRPSDEIIIELNLNRGRLVHKC